MEREVAELSHTKFAVGCASGTDALLLAFRALDIGPGDEVITSPFTFFATAGTIHMSVTVLAGNQVAYDFEPSGITFDQPLQFEQDVRDLVKDASVAPTDVPQVSYFKSTADLDPATGTARTYEDLPSGIDFSGHTLKADIWHFSGYIVSWSRR